MDLAWAVREVIGCDDVMCLVLRFFTHDEAKALTHVSTKLRRVTGLLPTEGRDKITWRLFTDEQAALDRLKLHFDYPELQPPHVLASYPQVCAVVRTLFQMHRTRTVELREGWQGGLVGRSIIGFRHLHVNNYRAWHTGLHALATTDALFTAVTPGDRIWTVYNCIRSIGMMPVPGSSFEPHVFAVLSHESWAYTLNRAYIEQLQRRSAAALRWRVGREAAAAARQWAERRAAADAARKARLARLAKQLA
jgi:hypothetical protein